MVAATWGGRHTLGAPVAPSSVGADAGGRVSHADTPGVVERPRLAEDVTRVEEPATASKVA
jgi:hypothetical protein